MTNRQVAALAIRVLAVYAIINSLGWLQSTLALFSMTLRSGTQLTLLGFSPPRASPFQWMGLGAL